MDNISASIAIALSLFVGLIIAIVVQLFYVPWQRRQITGNPHGGRVEFTINDSGESTPSESPKRKPRPSSFVQSEALPAITEQTELASFNHLSGLTPCFYANDKSQPNEQQKNHSIGNGNYKINPKILEKAEYLLGKNRSLDNTDLTITSLNFIDEHHQQQNAHIRSANQCEPLQIYFDNQLNHQLSPKTKQR